MHILCQFSEYEYVPTYPYNTKDIIPIFFEGIESTKEMNYLSSPLSVSAVFILKLDNPYTALLSFQLFGVVKT